MAMPYLSTPLDFRDLLFLNLVTEYGCLLLNSVPASLIWNVTIDGVCTTVGIDVRLGNLTFSPFLFHPESSKIDTIDS